MFLSNYNGDNGYNINFDMEAFKNVGVVVLILIIGLGILLALFFIANRRTLNKKSANYVNNSQVKVQNVVDVECEIKEPVYQNNPIHQQPQPQPKATEQEFLTNLYRKKYSGEITDAEFNAALARYRNSKDDFDD